MGRVKTPATMKTKQSILDLSDDEQDEVAAWFEMFMETRNQERERRQKREAKTETATQSELPK